MAKNENLGFHHTIYVSSATERLSQNELLALLKVARQKNAERGLTGMLLYRDGTYMQFLEGPRSEIDSLLARLREDPRHYGIRILREGILPSRLFPEWSMAWKNLAGLRSEHIPGYSECFQGQYMAEDISEEKSIGPVRLLVDMFHENLLSPVRQF